MPAQNKTNTAAYWTVIATNSVTIDLLNHAQSPRDAHGNAKQVPCRTIVVHKAGTGTLAVTKMNGTQVTLTAVVSGQELPGQVKKILPASAYSEIAVYW